MAGNETFLLGEEDFLEKMVQIVQPFLAKKRKEAYFKSFDGTKIYYEYYAGQNEKAAVVISHGFCEFAQKYEEVIFYFLQAGYAVYVLDHRGHGNSGRMVEDKSKVHINTYDEYVFDFDVFLNSVVLNGNIYSKLILYAHSMGGAIAALYLERHTDIFSCAVLSSPMFEINFGKIPKPIVWILVLLKELLGSDEDYLSGQRPFDGVSDYEASNCLSRARYDYIFSKRLSDPNLQTYGATWGWTRASLKAVRKVIKNAEQIKTPTLLFQAGKDKTVRPGGHIRFLRKSKIADFCVMSASKHEIYNADTETRRKYYKRIFEFIDEKLKIS